MEILRKMKQRYSDKSVYWEEILVLLVIALAFIVGFVCDFSREQQLVDSSTSQAIDAPVSYFVYDVEVRAYCACEKCCGRWADGYTASGQPVTANGGKFVAAGSMFELGDYVFVPGYDTEWVPVLDRCGSLEPYCLEVFFFDHQEALNWGVRELKVSHYQSE